MISVVELMPVFVLELMLSRFIPGLKAGRDFKTANA
jgi:hypothetical protein